MKKRVTHSSVIQSITALSMFSEWKKKLTEETYRVTYLDDGYYAVATPAFKEDMGSVDFEVTLVDMTFKAVGLIDVSTFPCPEVLVKFIRYKQDYLRLVTAFCVSLKGLEVEKGGFKLERDTKAEQAMREFFESHKVDAANPESFKL